MGTTFRLRAIACAFAILAPGVVAGVARAQVSGSGVEVGAALPAGFEPSGIDHHAGRDEFVVVSDDGRVALLAPDGALRASFALAGDLEGVCVADPNLDRAYLLREKPEALLEVDLVTGFVLRTFDLVPTLGSPNQRGVEGVEFLADPLHPEGGTFLVASTYDGRVYELELPIASSAVSNQVVLLHSFQPTASNDLRGLDADTDAGVLYLAYSDPFPQVRVTQLDGTPLASFGLPQPQVPDGAAEGLARRGCDLVVALDRGGAAAASVLRFDGAAGHSACRTFEGDSAGLSALFGGTQNLTLDLGPASAGFAYAVLGSGSLGRLGPTPDGLVLPLSIDAYFLQTLGGVGAPFYAGFVGVLDAQGRATATVSAPPFTPQLSGLVGVRLVHAAVVVDPGSGWFVHASNAVPLTISF